MPTSYVTEATDALRAAVCRQGKDPDEVMTPVLQQLYVLLVLTLGENVGLEDVHDAWAVARATERPDHPDLVPFVELSDEVAEYDRPFMEAIRDAAAWIWEA